MSRFIETIRAENGVIPHLRRHQERMSETLRDHGQTAVPDLQFLLKEADLSQPGRLRIRIEYGDDGWLQWAIYPYMRQTIDKMRMVNLIPPDYRYKYADRGWLRALRSQSGADEIIIVRDGLITDASIANLVFQDRSGWWTPDSPLLKGTERARLLELGIIREARIMPSDLSSFNGFRLINAMLPWEDDLTHDISLIDLKEI
jgi:4-amino-4-deoxychorismate lyase